MPLAAARCPSDACARILTRVLARPCRRSIVEFATADDLDYAIRRLDGSRLDGHRIEVVRESERGPPPGYVDDRGQGPSDDGGVLRRLSVFSPEALASCRRLTHARGLRRRTSKSR